MIQICSAHVENQFPKASFLLSETIYETKFGFPWNSSYINEKPQLGTEDHACNPRSWGVEIGRFKVGIGKNL
jgi:hypothetical protein